MSQPESWLSLQVQLENMNHDWQASLERLRVKNREGPPAVAALQAAGLFALARHEAARHEAVMEAAAERLWERRRGAAGAYARKRLRELCPPKVSLNREQCWPTLLRQAGAVYREALGLDLLAQAHAEIPERERIVLAEALGDLERADAAERCHLFRLDRQRLKISLFRALLAEAKHLRDRREDGEWWFPTAAPITVVEASAISELSRGDVPPVPRRPGRKPQRRTKSNALFDSYQARLKDRLRPNGEKAAAKATKANIARALKISKDTLNRFEREHARLESTTREKIATELNNGPTEEVIAYFVSRRSVDL
jgi:hypothetical protein